MSTNNSNQDVMAIRKGSLRLADGELVHVEIRIGKPWKRSEGDFQCDSTVEGLQLASSPYVVGYDAIQAFELALVHLGFLIESATPPGAKWEDWEDNMGLPRFGVPEQAAEKP